MSSSNRLPWIVAACAVTFALGVLLANVGRRDEAPRSVQALDVPPVQKTPAAGSAHPTPVRPAPSAPASTGTDAADTGVPVPSSPTPVRVERPGHRISGTVTDLQGNPIPHASVQILFDEKGSQMRVEAKADAKGRFSARNLPLPRAQSIVAEAPGFGRSEPMPPFDLPVDGLEIALRRMAGAELRILDARGGGEFRAFEGEATVYLMRQNGEAYSTATLRSEEAGVPGGPYTAIASDKALIKGGTHTLRSVEPGTYKAAVVVTGEDFAQSEPFKVDAAEGGEATVIIGQRQNLSAFVKSDPEQEPLAGVQVQLEAVDRPAVAGLSRSYRAVSGTDGRFVLQDVPPGDYRMLLESAGFTTKSIDQVTVPAGPPPPPATFYLVRVQPSVDVAVYGSGGRALAQAPLVLIASGAGARARSYFARTDQAGQYRFDAIPPGRYSLAVTSPDDRRRQKVMDLVVGEKDTTAPIVVRFAPTVRVGGRAQRKGKPIVDNMISFLPRGAVAPETFAKTDSEGNYAVDLEPGEYMAGEARQEGQVVVRVAPGEFQSADLELP